MKPKPNIVNTLEASKPIEEIESIMRPILTRMIEYGIRPKKVAPANIPKGTPTTAELALRNQFGTKGVKRRNMK
eukprot:CAMPEP_0185604462 /NCGR_PEP_ID=MMETSP0436-20130131/3312_1 /TAXON_ID=626734 ORGANISM="Favella taraikaensis, Strain Fe Narragansett Bay" /NCGR_SAMPLE_ID=MMETSP0436 /ASSEMBLY_ACC=CAM_ASM_000390 /LENGTH=73 /DNA_ID=CAMNT_0028235325 /DNA_START=117 /DNA_END=341 /DNA_ORIENTATION=-